LIANLDAGQDRKLETFRDETEDSPPPVALRRGNMIPETSGSWHEAQDNRPEPDSDGSKNIFLPRSDSARALRNTFVRDNP
jgi:hypothetical protein